MKYRILKVGEKQMKAFWICLFCALINVPSIILSHGQNWWNVLSFGFCLGLAIASYHYER